MAKTKKHRLPVDTEPDYVLIAIASHEKGYHLSWIFNQELGSRFTRSSDYKIMREQPKRELNFPVFLWEDEMKMLTYHLISNRTENGFLFEGLRNIDYFLHITPAPRQEFSDHLQTELKKLPVIYTCFLMDPDNRSGARTLRFD